jgi:phage-related protein (TIGR01555 family)
METRRRGRPRKFIKVDVNKVNNDGWQNVLSGLNVENKDKLLEGKPFFKLLNQSDFDNLYAGDDIARKIVDLIPNIGIKKGINIEGIEDIQKDKIFEKMKSIQVLDKILKAWKLARLYGGAGILLSVSDGNDLEEPLDIENINNLNNLTVFDKYELQADTSILTEDFSSQNFGMPEFYNLFLNNVNFTTKRIHYTRILKFNGILLTQRLFIENGYWHSSVLSPLYDSLSRFNQVNSYLSDIIFNYSVGTLKIKNIADLLAAGKDSLIRNRIITFDLVRSLKKTAILDSEEDYGFSSTSLAGISDIVDRINKRLVTASNIPHTLLFGDSPTGGLSGKGESEN